MLSLLTQISTPVVGCHITLSSLSFEKRQLSLEDFALGVLPDLMGSGHGGIGGWGARLLQEKLSMRVNMTRHGRSPVDASLQERLLS